MMLVNIAPIWDINEPAHTKPAIRHMWLAKSPINLLIQNMAKLHVHSSLNSLEAVEDICDQRNWSDSVNAQAELSSIVTQVLV